MMNNKLNFIKDINEAPNQVKISGNKQTIVLSYNETEVKFPVIKTIYTRCVCSLKDAEVISKGQMDHIGEEEVMALATAATNRQSSSFDLMFQ